jgi:hypothetical protein
MTCPLSFSMPEQAAIAPVMLVNIWNPPTLQWLDDHDPQGRLYRIARYVLIQQEVAS